MVKKRIVFILRARTKICKVDDHAQFINVVDNWIYYSNLNDGHKIYKIRTDGSGREQVR